MTEKSGSVTIIFYRTNMSTFWKEPILNLVAATATMSPFTHVEVAIGKYMHLYISEVCRLSDNLLFCIHRQRARYTGPDVERVSCVQRRCRGTPHDSEHNCTSSMTDRSLIRWN